MKEQHLSPNSLIEQAALQTFVLHDHKVQLYVPDAKAVQEAYRRNEISFPYWSKVWPAAIALTEFVLLHPAFIQNKRVVELGAGLGLPSLFAARFASSVLCTDHSPEAVQLAQLSAQHNNLSNIQTALLDWNHLPKDLEADVVLLSDINYEPDAFHALMKMVNHFMMKKTILLLSTPQRLMAKDFISPLQAFCTSRQEMDVRHEGKQVMISVMVLGAP